MREPCADKTVRCSQQRGFSLPLPPCPLHPGHVIRTFDICRTPTIAPLLQSPSCGIEERHFVRHALTCHCPQNAAKIHTRFRGFCRTPTIKPVETDREMQYTCPCKRITPRCRPAQRADTEKSRGKRNVAAKCFIAVHYSKCEL